MITPSGIQLDPREVSEIVTDLLARRPGYVREWLPPEKGPEVAIMQIFARYLHGVLQRLNRSPEKNKQAFLDLLGIQLIPTQSARAPVTFQLSSQATDSRVPAGTRLAAPPPPERTEQIVFETERATGLTAAKLIEVVSLWPGRDQYIDHTAALSAGQAFQPFKKKELRDTPHVIYIAHDTLLALAGKVRLDLEFELVQPSSEPLDILWEYWDGKIWRGFKAMNPSCGDKEEKLDGTSGLTRSGSFRLEADCAETSKTTVNKSSLRMTQISLGSLKSEGIPDDVLEKLENIQDQEIAGEANFLDVLKKMIGDQRTDQFKSAILKQVVRGIEAFWVRGRLTEPLPPNPAQVLPEVESIKLSTGISYSLSLSWSHDKKPGEQRARSHVVKVRDHVGVPLGGIKVIVSSSKQQEKLTDKNGEQLIELSSDAVSVSVSLAEFQSETVPLDVTPEEITFTLTSRGLSLERALSDSTSLDVSKPFYPFGLQPHPGSTFSFNQEDIFSKPGAKVRIYVARTSSPQDSVDVSTIQQGPIIEATNQPHKDTKPLEHVVAWEYWNGRQWVAIFQSSNSGKPSMDLNTTEIIDFTVPSDMVKTKVNDQEGLWMRARLVSGGFGFTQKVSWFDSQAQKSNDFTYVVSQPPVLADFRLGYTWQYGPFHPERVFAYNDFQYEDRTDEAKWPGRTFQPFKPVADVTPTLYFGFDKKLPVDRLGIYFDIVERRGEPQGPALLWEYWDGIAWRDFSVEDETRRLRIPGLLSFIAADDTQLLARFGTELHWLRGRLKEDGPPGEPTVSGIFPNAAWAVQRQTLTDETLGTSSGQPNQVFTFRQIPVLGGEHIEVRELTGPRANVEWRILAMDILGGDIKIIQEMEAMLGKEGSQTDIEMGDLRFRRDRKKRVTEVWVRWKAESHLFFSGSDDRHYVVERARGRLIFGDGEQGKVPPLGAAILARKYRTGGGLAGNVAAQTITQLLGGIAGIEAVFNPRPAEGGADAETLEALSGRGPKTLRHRGRALSAQDFETMAKEASPAVAFARAIPSRDPNGRKVPGWVTVLIIPQSGEPRPWPSFGLREHVRKFIEAHASADLAAMNHIYVTGPEYLAIDIAVAIVPLDPAEAGSVEARAREVLERFFHPLHGGPHAQGWELGRDVYLSDVASVLERTEGVDYVDEMALLINGALQRERVEVAEDRIVIAGEIRIGMKQ